MNNEWKYTVEIKNKDIFVEIEKIRNIVFPSELKEFVMEKNAATPAKYRFMLKNSEKVLGSVLSFNRGERDTDSVFTALEVIKDANLIPFCIDPFGNYICYVVTDNTIEFWDHETNESIKVSDSLDGFLNSLY